MFIPNLKLAYKSIFAHKKQSLLTMLGVIIGTASVITIVSVGSGAQSMITTQIKDFGTNLMAVIPGKTEEDGGPPPIARGIIITSLKNRDAKKIEAVPEVEFVLPIVIGNAVTNYKNNTENIPYWGVSHVYPSMHNVSLSEGRFFTKREEESSARVVVLGNDLKKDFFGEENPIGKNIKMDQRNFKVVGVLSPQGTSFFMNQDRYLFLSYKTAQNQLLGIDYLHFLRFKAKKAEDIPYLTSQVTNIIRRSHGITDPKNDDFSIRSQEQALDVLTSVTDGLKLFLSIIAGISLIVGGIGIMNMMLVAVTKRTKEIGLRKAVGAKRLDITYQFLVESTFLTGFGGMIGVIVGILISSLISLAIQETGYEWELIISVYSIVLALSIAFIIGIIFGAYPAIKAAKLHPIDALRYE